MDLKDYLGKTVTIKIDRALGSLHPKYGFVYELNYGYVPGTVAPDGEEIDAYLFGVKEPVEEFTGKCIAVVHRFNDDDDKLVVADVKTEVLDNFDIEQQIQFQEKYFKHIVIMKTKEKNEG